MRHAVPMPKVQRGAMHHQLGDHVVLWTSPSCELGVSLPFPSSRDARTWALRTLDGTEAVVSWMVVRAPDVAGLHVTV